MSYNSQDLYGMALRQAKVDIGQGRGNAMTNAISWAIAKNLTLEEAFEISDKIFHYQQFSIDKDFKGWLELNDKKLRLETGLEVPTIDYGKPVRPTTLNQEEQKKFDYIADKTGYYNG